MRNYFKLHFATYHIHKDVPLSDADGEVWRLAEDEFEARIRELQLQFEAAGFTFTVTGKFDAYWKLDQSNFGTLIEFAATAQNLKGFHTNYDPPILVFESPRRREQRNFLLVPIDQLDEIINVGDEDDLLSFLESLIES